MDDHQKKRASQMEDTEACMHGTTGVCPKCGEQMTPILIYEGRKGGSSVKKERSYHGTQTTITTTKTTTYHDVAPYMVGYCTACHKKLHDEKENEKANQSAPLVFLILSLALIILGVVSLILMVKFTKDLGIFGAIVMPFVGFVSVPFGFYALYKYLKARKLIKKYRNGYREPFEPMEHDDLDWCAKMKMAHNKKDENIFYFTPKEYKQMQMFSSLVL